jgi:hypothetical protein
MLDDNLARQSKNKFAGYRRQRILAGKGGGGCMAGEREISKLQLSHWCQMFGYVRSS